MKYNCYDKTKILGSVREMRRSFVDGITGSVYSFDRLTPFRPLDNTTFLLACLTSSFSGRCEVRKLSKSASG